MGKSRDYINGLKLKNKEEEQEKNASSTTSRLSQKYRLGLKVGFDTLETDLNTLGTTIQGIYDGWQTEETMKNTRSSIEAMQKRISAYQEYRKMFGDEKSADLTDLSSQYKSLLEGWDDLTYHYSKYKNADAYKKALEVAEKEVKEYEGMKTKDLNVVQTEIDDLQKILDTANSKRPKTNVTTSTRRGMGAIEDTKKRVEEQKAFDDYLKSVGFSNIDAIKKALSEKKAYFNQAEYIQGGIKLTNDALNSKDFEEYVQKGKELDDGGRLWYLANNNMNGNEVEAVRRNFDDGEALLGRSERTNMILSMNDEETQIYNYYLGKYGKGKAEEYLKSIEKGLNSRTADKYFSKLKGSTARELYFGVISGLDQFASGINNLFNTSDNYIPHSAIQITSGMAREDLDDDGPKILGNSLGKISYDLINTTSNMLPSILASAAVSYVNPALGAAVGAGLMGTSAAGNAYQEMLNKGYDKSQARTYSVLIGVSEAGLQYAFGGISKLGGKLTGKTITAIANGVDNALGRFAIQYGLNMASEGFEEAAQEILTPFFENLALGYAKNDFSDIEWQEVAYSGVLGALSAGFLEGGTTAISTFGENSKAKKTGANIRANNQVSGMLDIASLTQEETDAYNLYTHYAQKGVNAENISDLQLGRLYGMVGADAQNVLTSKNSTVEQKESAKKTLGDLSAYSQDTSVKKLGKKNIESLYGAYDAEGIIAEGLESGKDTESYKLATEYKAKVEKGEKLTTEEITNLVDANQSAYKEEVKAEAETKLTNLGENVKDNNLAEIIAKKSVGEKLTSEETKALENSEYGNRVYNEINNEEAVDYTKTMDKVEADLFLSVYDGKTNIEAFANSFNLVNGYANNKFTQDYILEHRGVLTPSQVSKIYKHNITNKIQLQQKALEDLKQKHKDSPKVYGTFDDSVIDYKNKGTKGKVNWNSLGSNQKNAIMLIGSLAVDKGMDVELISDGLERGINGGFEIQGNKILIDIYAGMPSKEALFDNLIIPTFSHELTHWMKEKSPELYRKYDEYVFGTLTANGKSETQILDERRLKMQKAHPGVKYTDEEVRDEVIARASEDMFGKSKVIGEFLDTLTNDEKKTFVDKVKEIFQKIKKWFETYIAKNVSNADEAKAIRENIDRIDGQIKLWDEMLLSSIAANQALKKEGITGEKLANKLGKSTVGSMQEMARKKPQFWHTGMNDAEVTRLENIAKRELNTTDNYIDNGNKWLYNKIGENTYFALYSTADTNNPTVLYACKGKQAKFEQQFLIDYVMEEVDDGEHNVIRTKTIDEILENYGYVNGKRDVHSRNTMGRGSNEGNAGVYSQNPRIKPSEAFLNCLRNIAETQERNKVVQNSDRDSDTYFRIVEMQKELNGLRNTIKEMQNSEDFKVAHDKLSKAIDSGDIEGGIKVYKEWQEKSGYAELSQKRDALQVELENLRKSFNDEITNKALKEEQDAIAKSGLSAADYFRKQAVKEFGYTPYFYDAGYITPNGRMLNFSGEKGKHYGSRGQDHRAIGIIYANVEGSKAMVKFMNGGNVRIMAESPGIDLSNLVEPTTEQYSTIRKFIYEYAKEEFFNVDLSDENGNVVGSLQYENKINPTRIINDIKHYYATGKIREQSNIDKFRYSDRDNSIENGNNAEYNNWESYELTSEFIKNVPYNERHTFLRSLANKTNGIKRGEHKNIVIITSNHIYFYEANGYMNGSIAKRSGLTKKSNAEIKAWSDYYGSIDTGTTTPYEMAEGYEGERRRNDWDYDASQNSRSKGRDDEVDEPSSESNSIGDTWESNGDFGTDEELVVGSIVYNDNGEAFKVNNDGSVETIKFSDRDSEGNTLSKEQQEFFKDSKVRDDNGNLMVVYHSTNADFTVFKDEFIGTGAGNSFGNGFYFASNKIDEYGKSKPYYLNINNPYFINLSENRFAKENELSEVIKFASFFGVNDEEVKNWYKYYSGYVNQAKATISKILDEADANDLSNLKELGYDGLIINNAIVGIDNKLMTTAFVAFNSSQAKLTTNKTPTSDPDIRYSDRDNVSIYDTLGETDALIKENAKLKEDVERLKERLKIERQVTHGNYFNENQLDAVAGHLRKISGSTIDKKELIPLLKDVYSYISHSPNLNWQDMFAQCYDIAAKMLNKAKPLTETNDYAKMILRDIRSARISLDEMQIQEARHRFGEKYRNAFMGKVIISNDGIPLDTRWQEWASAYPDFFDASVSSTDQITELYDVYSALKNASEIYVEYDEDQQTRWLAREIYNQFWNVSPVRTTADKYEKRIKLLNFEHRRTMKEFRDNYEDKLKTQHTADKEKYKALVKDIRDRKNKEIAEVKKLGRERMEAYKENAERKTLIQGITGNALTLNKWLTTNSKDYHIHEAMKGPVIKLLQAIDFSSKQMLDKNVPTKKDISFAEAFADVKAMLLEADNMAEGLQELYGHDLADSIEMLVQASYKLVGDNNYVLNQMNLKELQSLDRLVKSIKRVVSQLNKFHTVNHAKGIAHLAQEEIAYADSLGKTKVFDPQTMKAIARKLVNWDNKLPYYAFKQFGEAGKKIFEAFQDGWDKLSFHAKVIIDFTKETYTNKEVTNWAKDIKTFDVSLPAASIELFNTNYKPKSQKVQISVPQIMSLYCLMKREQAKGHILGGGIRVANIRMKNGQLIQQSEGVVLTESDINKIINTLTTRQKQVADALQKFMNTVCAAWGNDVSMARFGYEAFGEENYFPIESDANNLKGKDAPQDNGNSLFKLLNMSFTKNTMPDANNRIVIRDIFDVFASHSSDMAKYNALALPVLDANRWFNYTEKIPTGETQFITKSVKQSIENAFGEEGQKYINKFIEDINGQKNTGRDTLGKEFFSKAKVASVAANLRVALLQPTAYLKASAIMKNRYLTKAFLHKPKFKHAEKYCGIALWKSLGYYDTDISRGLTEKIKHQETWKDKAVEISMKGAEWGDKITFGYLWNACELEIRDTRKDLKVGSDEFFNAVGKRLREVIYATQVVDSTMTRSQLMRSGNMYEKMLTAFSSEPVLAFNMLQDAYVVTKLDAKLIGKKEALKKNGKKIARVVVAYTVTNAIAALIESGFDAFRDDDDEEMDAAKFMEYYLTNFLTDMSISGKIPYVKELVSIAQGFSSSRTDTQWMQLFTNVMSNVYKISQGKGNPSKLLKDSIKLASYFIGLPFYNVYRDTMAALNKLDILTSEELKEMLEDLFG